MTRKGYLLETWVEALKMRRTSGSIRMAMSCFSTNCWFLASILAWTQSANGLPTRV